MVSFPISVTKPGSSNIRLALALAAVVFGSTEAVMGANVITNGSFEIPPLTGTNVALVNESLVPGWDTTAPDDLIELWSNGFQTVISADAAQHAELNANFVSTLYQDVSGIPANSGVGYSFAHRGRGGVDTVELRISDLGTDNAAGGVGTAADTILFNQQFSTGNTSWSQYSAGTIGPLTLGNDMRFAFASISAFGGIQTIGNFLDNVSFGVGVGIPEPTSCLLMLVAMTPIVFSRSRRA